MNPDLTTKSSHLEESTAIDASFRRLALLAHGGFGVIELAIRPPDGQLYAVKRLHPSEASDPGRMDMFLDEARLASRIHHENVVAVRDTGCDANGPFIAMDFVEGLDLRAVIDGTREALPAQLCASIAAQVAHGLHAAHEARDVDGEPLGLVHRDLAPPNVLVGVDGRVRLLDFGVAKAKRRFTATASGVRKGRYSYMSPEQVANQPLDRRSDLFSLGVVLHELLSGQHPFEGEDGIARAVAVMHRAEPVRIRDVRPDVPPSLEVLLAELLAFTPEERPPTAANVARRLDALVSELAASEGPISLEDHLSNMFGNELAEQRRLVEAAVRPRHPSVPPAPAPAAPSTRSLVWLAAALITVGAGLGFALAAFLAPT